MNEREKALKTLSAAQFAAHEMNLYLDTHANERKAFEVYKKYLSTEKAARENYVKNFGPLRAADSYGDTSFEWVNSPWPWVKD